ncbi:MAG: hypothetical protein JWO90_2226 [Solirubrobacterales bacterium]|jgi:phosphate/sulfate permease|nr:hypothetical protein [Solirubrobacterales bacterium]
MRGVIDFYRRNPIVLVVAVVVGLVVSLLAASGDSESIVTEVVAVGAVGLGLGLFIAWRRSRDA